jgi:hypothetical protein
MPQVGGVLRQGEVPLLSTDHGGVVRFIAASNGL